MGAPFLRHVRLCLSVGLFVILLCDVPVFAGPPFRTDDPETVDYKHWEFYTATQYQNDKGDLSGTVPHFEFNYGVVPNVQLHLIVPDAYDRPKEGPSQFGLGNVELGVKYRFVQETDYIPMVGIFPSLKHPRGVGRGDWERASPNFFSLCGSRRAGGRGRPMAEVGTG